MAPETTSDDSIEANRDALKSTHGHETRTLDVAGDDHVLSEMDSKRQAPIEHIAENVVSRYDETEAFLREYAANAHTACVQAARYKIRSNGDEDDVDMQDVRDVLAYAKEQYGYEPTIQIQYNRNPDANWTFRIADNGIGIPRQKAPAIRDIGLSGWHDDGTTNGQFGQGTMSGFLPTTPYGEFHMTTRARRNDDDYRVAWKLTDVNKLPGERGSYGTTFEWPVWTDEAHDEIDVYDAVRNYVEGFIVPVLYEEYDEDGALINEDDFTPSYIEERYADESPIVAYEDQFARVVWSPDNPEGWSSNLKTWCGYQPIDRNDGRYGTSHKAYAMPSGFDARVKVENGCIVTIDGSTDHELVGQVPVSDQQYENMPDEKTEGFVPRSEIPDDADVIQAPEPTDDRDRFESKHVEPFFRRYARKLEAELKQQVGDIIETMDDFTAIGDLDEQDQDLFFEAVDEYIDMYKKNDADRLMEDLAEEFDADVSEDFAEKMAVINKEVSVADPDSAGSPSKKRNRDSKKVWKVVRDADGDDVYMGQTLTPWKANVAWNLKENNQVVAVDTSNYQKWEDLFGWKLLKNLPSRRSLEDKLGDELPDDVIEKYSAKSGGSTTTSSSSIDTDGYNDERAKQRVTKVRTGRGRSNLTRYTGAKLFETLNDDATFTIDYDRFHTLILYDQTEGHGVEAGAQVAGSSKGVAYAVVPSYVYDYLIQADNVMTEQEYRQSRKDQMVEFDWTRNDLRTESRIGAMDERDVFVAINSGTLDSFEQWDMLDDLHEAIADQLDLDAIDSITYEHPKNYYEVMNDNGIIEMAQEPSVVKVDRRVGYDYTVDANVNVGDLFFDTVLPDLDRSATEWDMFDPSMDDEQCIETLKTLQDAGGFVSTDDDASIPETPDCVSSYAEPSDDSKWNTLTLQRLEEAQGDD